MSQFIPMELVPVLLDFYWEGRMLLFDYLGGNASGTSRTDGMSN